MCLFSLTSLIWRLAAPNPWIKTPDLPTARKTSTSARPPLEFILMINAAFRLREVQSCLKKLSVQGSGTSTALRLYGTYFHQTLLTISLHRAKGQTSRHFLSNMTSNRIITCEEHKLREQCQKDQTGAAKPEMSFYWNTISWSTWGHILKLSANTLKANLKNSGK